MEDEVGFVFGNRGSETVGAEKGTDAGRLPEDCLVSLRVGRRQGLRRRLPGSHLGARGSVEVLRTTLRALDEHSPHYSGLLGIARSLREQIDWQQLRECAGDSP